jgi:hypothetical protein
VGDAEIVFDDKIYQHLEVSDMLILLMIGYDDYFPKENVFGVSLAEKKIKWQIAKLEYVTGEVDCPFIGILSFEGRLRLNNWCSIYLIVDPLTGEILERSLPMKY